MQDSTFVERYADIYIDSVASLGTELRLKPLSDYDGEVVRARSEGGWGTFDAIATIYRDTDCNIQMVKQNIGSRSAPRGFQIQEYSMPLNKCDAIFEMVDNQDFYNLQFDLDPDWRILDGNTYSISYRGAKNKHVVTWQLFQKETYGENSDKFKLEKGIAERVYHDLFMFAKRPLPCIDFYFLETKQDSFIYLSSNRESYDFVDSIVYTCSDCTVRYSDHASDTIVLKEQYDDYGYKKREIEIFLYTRERLKLKGDCTNFIEPEVEYDE